MSEFKKDLREFIDENKALLQKDIEELLQEGYSLEQPSRVLH